MLDSRYVLVHANIAKMKAPLEDPRMEGFVSQIEEIDQLAAQNPGFILQPTSPDEGEVFPNDVLVNVSIWRDFESLRQFTYEGRHFEVLQEGHLWFEEGVPPTYVLYWLEKEKTPTHKEIFTRLQYLDRHGPTPYAFDFEEPYSINDLQVWLT